MSFASTIQNIANQAGLKVITQNDDYVQAGFNLGEDRTQLVHMMPAGDLAGKAVVRISTPVAKLPGGGFPQGVAEGLLKENGSFKIGSFNIVEQGADRLLMFGHNMLLEDLAPGEFEIVVRVLASTGDEWEKKLSQGDSF